ncbi:protein Mo25 [Planococcus citri]|uniref:protein Mo25 n=1 Tax=Planococcus citri TaxID=170843 RepID=UPI0031F92E3C
MPLFGKSQKSPTEVVRALKDALIALERGDKKSDKAQEDVSKNLLLIKNMLYGNSECEPQTDIVVAQVAQEFYNNNLLYSLICNLSKIDFEGKKDVAQVFNNILRRQIGTRSPTVEYICTKPEILFTLMCGYELQEIALNCGSMLRECARYEALAKIMLNSEDFFNFFRYVEVSTFDIASDAFSTFKELLTRHKIICAEFLEQNYEKVFKHYQRLLNSENYVTRRQSLKLLGELLLDRHNFTVMTRYISNPDNLKLMMNMLKEKSRNIQFEAFHVFKVFVANPNKPKPILDILLRNQEKLVDFLSRFHTDRSEDEQFNDEKAYLIKQIKELKPMQSSSSTGGASSSTSYSSTTTYFSANTSSKSTFVTSNTTSTTVSDSADVTSSTGNVGTSNAVGSKSHGAVTSTSFNDTPSTSINASYTSSTTLNASSSGNVPSSSSITNIIPSSVHSSSVSSNAYNTNISTSNTSYRNVDNISDKPVLFD